MATYNSSIITEAGIALIAKVTAGQVQDINITRVVTDDSDYSEVENLAALEQPLNLRHSFPISKKEVVNEKTVFLRSVITNKDLDDAGYRITALGVMAQDPDKGEILYAVATAQEGKGDYFDAYNGYLPSTITVDFYIEVSNAAQVIINGGASGPATAEDLEKLAEELEKLKEAAEPLSGSGAPTTETVGAVGQHYIDTETNYVYICTKILPDGQYVWVQVNGGSSGGSVDEAIADHNKDPNAHSTIIAAAVSEEVAKMAEGGSIVTKDTMEQAVEDQVDKALAALPAGSYYGYLDITIPASGWTEAEGPSADHNYTCDGAAEGVTADLIPFGGPKLGSCGVANKAEVVSGCETLEGAVRFYSKKIPEADISAFIILLEQGKGETDYELPVATETTLGGVKIGEGLAITPDGTATVEGAPIAEGEKATVADANAVMDEVYKDGEGS